MEPTATRGQYVLECSRALNVDKGRVENQRSKRETLGRRCDVCYTRKITCFNWERKKFRKSPRGSSVYPEGTDGTVWEESEDKRGKCKDCESKRLDWSRNSWGTRREVRSLGGTGGHRERTNWQQVGSPETVLNQNRGFGPKLRRRLKSQGDEEKLVHIKLTNKCIDREHEPSSRDR